MKIPDRQLREDRDWYGRNVPTELEDREFSNYEELCWFVKHSYKNEYSQYGLEGKAGICFDGDSFKPKLEVTPILGDVENSFRNGENNDRFAKDITKDITKGTFLANQQIIKEKVFFEESGDKGSETIADFKVVRGKVVTGKTKDGGNIYGAEIDANIGGYTGGARVASKEKSDYSQEELGFEAGKGKYQNGITGEISIKSEVYTATYEITSPDFKRPFEIEDALNRSTIAYTGMEQEIRKNYDEELQVEWEEYLEKVKINTRQKVNLDQSIENATSESQILHDDRILDMRDKQLQHKLENGLNQCYERDMSVDDIIKHELQRAPNLEEYTIPNTEPDFTNYSPSESYRPYIVPEQGNILHYMMDHKLEDVTGFINQPGNEYLDYRLNDRAYKNQCIPVAAGETLHLPDNSPLFSCLPETEISRKQELTNPDINSGCWGTEQKNTEVPSAANAANCNPPQYREIDLGYDEAQKEIAHQPAPIELSSTNKVANDLKELALMVGYDLDTDETDIKKDDLSISLG